MENQDVIGPKPCPDDDLLVVLTMLDASLVEDQDVKWTETLALSTKPRSVDMPLGWWNTGR